MQRARPFELAARELHIGASAGHLGHILHGKRGAAGNAEPGFNLRGVGLRFNRLRFTLSRRQSHEAVAGADAAATLHRGRDHPAGHFGGDLSLLLRGEGAADADEALDRLLHHLDGRDVDHRGISGRGRGISAGTVARDRKHGG